MKSFYQRLRHLVGRRDAPPRSLMICGLDYEHYRIQALVKSSGRYNVQALINDFPWNHGTMVDGVRVYYPSETPSLARRHAVNTILYYQPSDLDVFDAETRSALDDLNVAFIRIDPGHIDTLDEYLNTRNAGH